MKCDAGAWKHVACSSVGRDHLKREQPLQDAVSVHQEQQHLVFCLADGAGSARFSEVGANLTVHFLVEALTELSREAQVTHDQLETLLAKARQNLIAKAEELNTELRELSCTLVGGVFTQDGGIGFQIGDGGMVIRKSLSKPYELLTVPEQGQYANETFFLTSADWASHLQFMVVEGPVIQIAAFTDGLQNLALEKKAAWAPFEKFFIPFFDLVASDTPLHEKAEMVQSFLDSDKVCDVTGDDKTLLIGILHERC